MQYILDTNIFCWLREGRLQLTDLPSERPFAATHIQIDELNKTKNSSIRSQLNEVFIELTPEVLPTETFVVDVSRVDIDKMGGGVLFNKLLEALNILNQSKPNNIMDALIGEVALTQKLALLTADKDLAEVMQKHEGTVILFPPTKGGVGRC